MNEKIESLIQEKIKLSIDEASEILKTRLSYNLNNPDPHQKSVLEQPKPPEGWFVPMVWNLKQESKQ